MQALATFQAVIFAIALVVMFLALCLFRAERCKVGAVVKQVAYAVVAMVTATRDAPRSPHDGGGPPPASPTTR